MMNQGSIMANFAEHFASVFTLNIRIGDSTNNVENHSIPSSIEKLFPDVNERDIRDTVRRLKPKKV